MSEIYRISLNRRDLDSVIEHFANAGLAEVVVDEQGEIIFNIKKNSSLKINPHIPHQKLISEIKKIKTRLGKLSENSKSRKTLETKLGHYEAALKLVKE